MFIEIVLGCIIALIVLYLIFIYIKWASGISDASEMYKYLPAGVSPNDAETLSKYGWLLPPIVLSDTFKYINFWMQYYGARIKFEFSK
jgi:hypothetical protein